MNTTLPINFHYTLYFMNTQQSLSTDQEIQIPPTAGGCGGRVALYIVALLIAFATGSWFSTRTMSTPDSQTFVTSSKSFEKPVIVQVSGSVKNPGVYELPFNSRVYQAISKAGGLLPDAETDNINLADWVKDGSQINVTSKITPSPQTTEPEESDSAADAIPLGLNSDAETSPPKSTSTRETKSASPRLTPSKPHKSTSKEPPKTPIDLNRATSEELQQLPGIGPAMAGRILQYRKENKGFTSVDDLDNVRGVGAKTLEKLRPFVIVKPLPFQKKSSDYLPNQ